MPISMASAASIEADAIKHKLHARAIASKVKDEEGWLVIGSDLSSIEAIFERIKGEQKQTKGGLPMTLSSGAFGAVATWLILAYS